MTIPSWRAEYYPVPAYNIETFEDAIKHSILKWTGLKPENLAKHGLVSRVNRLKIRSIFEEHAKFAVDSDNCALCQIAVKAPTFCSVCPLYRVLGDTCFRAGMPYEVWQRTGDVQPMLDALQAADKLYKSYERKD